MSSNGVPLSQLPPKVAVKPSEAAAMLSVSLRSFERHVAHDLRAVRRGSLVLYLVRDIEAWAEAHAERVLESAA